jgi:hypothetical protein
MPHQDQHRQFIGFKSVSAQKAGAFCLRDG